MPYKLSSSAGVAKTLVVLLDPRSRGFYTRLRILQCLAGSSTPLSAREVAARTGVPARTVRYHLLKLWRLGWVWRSSSRRRSPDTVYTVTDAGLEALKMMLLNSRHTGSNSRQPKTKPRGLGGGGCRCGSGGVSSGVLSGVDGCRFNGGSVRVGGGVGVWVVWQPMSVYHGEVGFRLCRRDFGRVVRWFAGLCGYRCRGRLRRVMVYAGRDGVHVDVVVRSHEAARAFRLGFDGVLLLCLPSLFKAWVALSLLLSGVMFRVLVKAAKLAVVELVGLRVSGMVPQL